MGGGRSSREGGEGFQPHIDADGFSGGRQGRGFPFARDGYKPFARRRTADRRRLGGPLQWAVREEFHIPDLGEQQALATGAELAPVLPLRIGQAVIPTLAPKTWIARLLTLLQPTKEGIHRFL